MIAFVLFLDSDAHRRLPAGITPHYHLSTIGGCGATAAEPLAGQPRPRADSESFSPAITTGMESVALISIAPVLSTSSALVPFKACRPPVENLFYWAV